MVAAFVAVATAVQPLQHDDGVATRRHTQSAGGETGSAGGARPRAGMQVLREGPIAHNYSNNKLVALMSYKDSGPAAAGGDNLLPQLKLAIGARCATTTPGTSKGHHRDGCPEQHVGRPLQN